MGSFDSILLIVLSITIFLFQSQLLYVSIVEAKDTLFPGEELHGNLSNGIFTLGFLSFSPSQVSYANLSLTEITYLAIWFTSYTGMNTVWTANRDQPINGEYYYYGGAILTMDAASGILRVKNQSGATLFNVSDDKDGLGNKNNTRAKLLDSGNLIVYDVVTNRTIWESFDHPTDTLITGMKLGYNHTAKKNWELTSAGEDTQVQTSGAFTMRLELYQKSPQLVIYRREELYWASGPWNDTTGTFQWLSNSFFNLIYDPSGMYLVLEIIESDVSTSRTTMHLSPIGHFPDYSEDYCYGNGHGYEHMSVPGCVVSALPHCRAISSENDAVYGWEFDKRITIGPHYRIDEDSSISVGDCMERCWNDCGCDACSTYNNNGTGCIYRTHHNPHISGPRVQASQSFNYVLVPYKIYPKKSRWILLSLAIVPILVLAYVMMRIRIIKEKENRRRDDIIRQLISSTSFNYGDELERDIQDAPGVKIFSLKAILAATSNFSDENKLGQGGYGPVYKGELSDGRKIAVKRLSKTSGQGIIEFKSELILISKLQHTNLVRLYGCCIHQEERMLIYEFMSNKSLDFFLFDDDDDKKEKLEWHIRFKIIEGIAQGLLYLHKYSRMRVIHRDLKVSNVLLDENMNPKIADFGMARIFQHDMSVLMTNRVAGTYGYMAPEYVIHGTFSIKLDIFSFGVLILEIVSGKKNSSFHSLLRCVWELWVREATAEIKDDALGECFDMNQLLRAIHVGLLCVQEHANDRPTMSHVISMLNNEIVNLPIPKQPLFFMHPDEVDITRSTEHLLDNNIQGSINGLSITMMEKR